MSQTFSTQEPDISDEELMLNYSRGDMVAFEHLYLKHKGGLYRYFVRQIGDQQLAEDLYQETWSRVIRAAAQYQSTAKFTTWLYKIAHHLLIDHVRAVKPVDLVPEIDDVNDIDREDLNALDRMYIQQQKSQVLKHCIALLPWVQKEALILNFELGFTAKMISQVVNVTYEATKSRLRYANQNVKECVAQKWQDTDLDFCTNDTSAFSSLSSTSRKESTHGAEEE